MARIAFVAVLVVALPACGGDDTSADAGHRPRADAGVPCGAWEAPGDDGACKAAGVPADRCAAGFVAGDGGCSPVLPDVACGDGEMALPGETACRPVMGCGSAPWGDVPVDGTAHHVDAAYAGGGSDGTAAKPWTTIQDGIDYAAAGDMVVVAEGEYAEDIYIGGKPVRLWGRCPDKVVVTGTGLMFTTVLIDAGASGSEVHGLSVLGSGQGISASGSKDILLDSLWVHDTAGRGFDVENAVAAAVVTIRQSLVERATEVGIAVLGAEARIEATAVRDTRSAQKTAGHAVVAQDGKGGARATVQISGSLFERNRDVAVTVVSSDLTVDASVIRDTEPRDLDQTAGWGMMVWDDPDPAKLTLRASVLSGNHEAGIVVLGSEATIEATVVRGTLPSNDAEPDGLGIVVQDDIDLARRSTVSLVGSLLDQNVQAGLSVIGSDATGDSLVVRRTALSPNDVGISRGINVSLDPVSMQRASLTLGSSVLDQNVAAGVTVIDADATLSHLVVRASLADPKGLYGDGIAVATFYPPAATATITGVRLEGNARAGVLAFGAEVAVGASVFDCNLFDLDAEPSEGLAAKLEDQGGNDCGCGAESKTCQASTANLAPPTR